MPTFPNDPDGLALKRMAEHGIDMNALANFEFCIDTKNKKVSVAIVDALKAAQIDGDIEIMYDEGELEQGEEPTEENKGFWPSWTVYVRLHLIPEYSRIIDIQQKLDHVARPHGGQIDGWGLASQ